MIEIHSLFYQIDQKMILEDINLSFSPGKINLILGPNGSGKSTLLKCIAGSLKPSLGTITWSQQSITSFTTSELAKKRAVLSQNIEITFPISVREVVMMGRYPHFEFQPSKNDEKIVQESLEKFDLLSFENRNYQTLSGGERQRVQFARVLAQINHSQQETLLLLDEPLTYLDVNHQYEFMSFLNELSQQPNLYIIGVIHDLNLAAKYAADLTLLNEGKVVATGKMEEVLSIENIQSVFGLEAEIIIHKGILRILF